MSWSRLASIALLAAASSGCAGGWRNGPPPGSAAPTATAGAAATPRAAGASAADGVRFVYKGAGNSVAVAGEFNSWNTSADPMAKQADGGWLLVKRLDPGRYQYKFVIDGTTWKADDSATETADDGFGGKNSVVVVGGNPGAAPTGGAAAAGAAPAAPATAAPTPVTGKAAPPKVTPDGVQFTFAGEASQVTLAGDFNGWSTSTDPLARQPDGTWSIVKQLPPGTYGYKFLVNGKIWKQDDANPEAKDDGFGGKNSIITVR